MQPSRLRAARRRSAPAPLAGRRRRRDHRARAGRRRYAPAATAQIHPGTMMYTDGAQCTANFVYTDGAGNDLRRVRRALRRHRRGHRHRRLPAPTRCRWAPR